MSCEVNAENYVDTQVSWQKVQTNLIGYYKGVRWPRRLLSAGFAVFAGYRLAQITSDSVHQILQGDQWQQIAQDVIMPAWQSGDVIQAAAAAGLSLFFWMKASGGQGLQRLINQAESKYADSVKGQEAGEKFAEIGRKDPDFNGCLFWYHPYHRKEAARVEHGIREDIIPSGFSFAVTPALASMPIVDAYAQLTQNAPFDDPARLAVSSALGVLFAGAAVLSAKNYYYVSRAHSNARRTVEQFDHAIEYQDQHNFVRPAAYLHAKARAMVRAMRGEREASPS